MRLFSRRAEGERLAAVPETPAEPPAPPPPDLRTLPGTLYCSARLCSEETGIPCAYVDRRQRQCPTAWCPEHRHILENAVYCPAHAGLLSGTHSDFADSHHPDLENRVPAVVNWITREVDDPVQGMLERLADDYGERLVVDPVRFVLVGVERTRTWERSWKMVAHHGVTLRVAVAVEEGRPTVVLGKVNSKVKLELAVPWNEEIGVGEPEESSDAASHLRVFREQLFMGLARSVLEWEQANPAPPKPAPAPDVASLDGGPQPWGVLPPPAPAAWAPAPPGPPAAPG